MIQGERRKQVFIPLILRLTSRAVVFLFFLLATAVCFYAAGCAQSFLDSDITFLLFCITSISLLLVLFSAVSFCECVIFLILYKRLFFLFYSLFFVFLGVFSVVVAFLSNGINLLARGV